MPRHATAAPARRPTPGSEVAVPYIVLVGLDLSEPGGRAWRFAFELAHMKGPDSEVHAVVVGPRAMATELGDVSARVTARLRSSEPDSERPSAPPPPSQPRLRVLQHRSADSDKRLMAMHFRTGRPDRAIVDLAREIGADVIVVATQDASPLQRLLLGGTIADRIARAAPCPVFVVRPKADEADGAEEALSGPSTSRR